MSRPASPPARRPAPTRTQRDFAVTLDGFEGPFDLLLSLLARHRLDLTEISLAKVTDDFLAYLHAHGPHWDLDRASDFLVVAATLLDLKAARLLPVPAAEDPQDLELLEARDLLFARLLQHSAYRAAADLLAARLAEHGRSYPRTVPLEPDLAALLPPVVLGLDAAQLAALAERALAPPAAPPTVPVAHLHAPAVDIGEQTALLVARLRGRPPAPFAALVAGCPAAVVVARFLALLDLYRGGDVDFEQVQSLGELTVRWAGAPALVAAAAS